MKRTTETIYHIEMNEDDYNHLRGLMSYISDPAGSDNEEGMRINVSASDVAFASKFLYELL